MTWFPQPNQKKKTFDELTKLVQKQVSPSLSVLVARYRFNSRSRKPEESVSAYAAELCHLTEHCTYGDVLGEMLRDQLVCGINNEVIQRRLLAEDKLTFDRDLEMALCMESAASHARDMSRSAPVSLPASVNVIKHSQESAKSSGKLCFRCRRGKHDPNDCSFKDATCHKCGKVRHITPACPSGKNAAASQPAPNKQYKGSSNRKYQPKSQSAHHVQTEGGGETLAPSSEYNMYTIDHVDSPTITHCPMQRSYVSMVITLPWR